MAARSKKPGCWRSLGMDAWMHMDAWTHGCLDAWMHGCMYACMQCWRSSLAAAVDCSLRRARFTRRRCATGWLQLKEICRVHSMLCRLPLRIAPALKSSNQQWPGHVPCGSEIWRRGASKHLGLGALKPRVGSCGALVSHPCGPLGLEAYGILGHMGPLASELPKRKSLDMSGHRRGMA